MEKEDYIAFDKWVKQCPELFNENISPTLRQFLYKLKNYKDKNAKNNFYHRIIVCLTKIRDTNIKKINSSSISNFKQLCSELEDSIILDNHWSIFYNTYTLAERIAGVIIARENKIIESDFAGMKSKIEGGNFTLQNKINLLTKIYDHYKTDDLKLFIMFITLFQRIRNKFMFHIQNFDEFYFVFEPDIGKKEELLQKIVKSIKEEVDKLTDEFSGGEDIKKILDAYSSNFDNIITHFNGSKSGGDTMVNSFFIYNKLPFYFSQLAFGFIIFFSKDDLTLFTKEETDFKKFIEELLKEIEKSEEAIEETKPEEETSD